MTSEKQDDETTLYRELAKIEQFKKEYKGDLKALKTKLTRLSKRTEGLELLDFQQQIISLKDSLDNIQVSLLGTQHFLADFYIQWVEGIVLDAANQDLSESTTPNFIEAKEAITNLASTATEKAKHSLEPLSMANKFREICLKYCQDNHIDAFTYY